MTHWTFAAFVALMASFTVSLLALFDLARAVRRVDENLWRRLGSPTVKRGADGIALVPASPLLRWVLTAKRADVPKGARGHLLVTRMFAIADLAFAAVVVVAWVSSLLP